jgi:hypothetical protein
MNLLLPLREKLSFTREGLVLDGGTYETIMLTRFCGACGACGVILLFVLVFVLSCLISLLASPLFGERPDGQSAYYSLSLAS